MRLSVRISLVAPGVYELPERCPHSNCGGKHSEKHQDHCAKAIRDPKYEAVEAQRYRCLKCGGTCWVYPKGISRSHRASLLPFGGRAVVDVGETEERQYIEPKMTT